MRLQSVPVFIYRFFRRQSMYKLSHAHNGRCYAGTRTRVSIVGGRVGSASEAKCFTRNLREEQKKQQRRAFYASWFRPDRLLCMYKRMYRGFVRVRLPRRRRCLPQPPIGRSAAVRYLVLGTLPPAHPSGRTHCCCCFARSSLHTCSRLRAAAVSNLTDAPAFSV